MAEKSLEERVNMLERGVEILEQLPDRVTALEVQIVELRGEMRAEFSATRAEAREGDERVLQTLREEIRAGDERVIQTLRQEIHAGDEHVVQTLRQEIRAGDEETRRFMRILYEDLVERIEILGGKR
jgi:F0F1-type ATP synthase membrane subunit b/b'